MASIRMTGIEKMTGTWGNDSLTGSATADVIRGLPGDDLIYGLGGDDRIYSGSGADTVFGGDGDDVIVDARSNSTDDWFPYDGVNELHGGAGNDRILAVNGMWYSWESPIFRLFGDEGDDVLRIRFGAAEAYGGTGNDRIFLSGYGGVVAGAYGGEGNDVLWAADPKVIYDPVEMDQYSPGGRQVLDGGAGNDKIFCYGYTQDVVVMAPGGGRDTVRNFNVNPDIEHFGPVDVIDFTAFDLEISVEDFIETRVVDKGDFLLLRPDGDTTLVLWGVEADQLTDSLLL